jgi:hypothetical protein
MICSGPTTICTDRRSGQGTISNSVISGA